MPKGIEMIVQNKLIMEKRDLNVYHHSTRSAYIISHGNSINLPLRNIEEGDYLHLSIVSGPGSMEKKCWINIPSWCDFTVSGLGNGDLTHSGERILLAIPPGPPVWQLKITRSSNSDKSPINNYVTIDDGENERGGR